MITATARPQQLRPKAEHRLAAFAELIATAIASAQARAELTASRARIVATADETRRRIERDLHDGAQQRLVSLALQLRAAQGTVPPELGDLRAELGRVAVGLTGTLNELREYARAVEPGGCDRVARRARVVRHRLGDLGLGQLLRRVHVLQALGREHLPSRRDRGRADGASSPGSRLLWPMRLLCISCAKITPPAACTASVTVRQFTTCSSECRPGVAGYPWPTTNAELEPTRGGETSVPTVAGAPMTVAIFRAARAHRIMAGNLLRQTGLYPGQELLMMQLWERGEQRQADLIKSLGLDPSTVTKMLQPGAVRLRHPQALPRRSQGGRRRRDKGGPRATRPRHAGLARPGDGHGADFTEEEHAQAMRVLARIEKNLTRVASGYDDADIIC